MSDYDGQQDPYVYPGTGVLKNKLGIKDAEKLEIAERDITALRHKDLDKKPVRGQFDLAHLQAIHKKLFSDIYPWAGKIRTVDISKGNSLFAHAGFIEGYLSGVYRELNQEKNLKGLPPDKFSERAAYYMGEINAAHPFREGNGRSTREFIGQLARQNGYKIAWENISKEEMTQASIRSMHGGDNSHLARLIKNNLVQVETVKQQQKTTQPKITPAKLAEGLAKKAVQQKQQLTAHKPPEQAKIQSVKDTVQQQSQKAGESQNNKPKV